MKVTRLIREYVTKSISEAYAQKKNPYEKLLEADNEKLKKFNEKLNEKIKKEATKFFDENEYVYYSWSTGDDKRFVGSEYRSYQSHVPHSKYEVLSENWRKELAKEKSAKIDEVLLNLELGANRTELDAMLKHIVKETLEE